MNRDAQAHKTHLLTCSQGCWGKCVSLGQVQSSCFSLLKRLRRHGASPTQQWQAAGGTLRVLHEFFFTCKHFSLRTMNLCSTAGLSGNEARSTQVWYGAQHQMCTPCAVMTWIPRKAGTVSYSHCWIILLSETTVCFWGLKTVPESHGFLNCLSCSTPLNCAEHNPLAWMTSLCILHPGSDPPEGFGSTPCPVPASQLSSNPLESHHPLLRAVVSRHQTPNSGKWEFGKE